MFTKALLTRTKTWKQPKCPLTGKWIKMWYMYIVEYYSIIKTNEIMTLAAMWMYVGIIRQSEVSQIKTNISLIYKK